MTDNRKNNELRDIKITRNYILYPEGSVLIEMGNTKVICNASISESVPKFLEKTGTGWVTAEYSMLPRATNTRNARDIKKNRENPRAVEIQRLIGRSLRSAIDLKKLGERSIIIDCDVIQADGGTRCASITGGFIALYDACESLVANKLLKKNPIKNFVAAISVGIVNGEVVLDLAYEQDKNADVDMNVVKNDKDEYIEMQGTGEKSTFTQEQLNMMIDYSNLGISSLIAIQKNILDK